MTKSLSQVSFRQCFSYKVSSGTESKVWESKAERTKAAKVQCCRNNGQLRGENV